jgi:tetratricopeptide (TPR) repeat protein
MKLNRTLFIIFALLGGVLSLRGAFADAEDKQAHVFLDGIRQYEAKAYREAISSFEKLIEAGIRNGNLFYNLGNAYLKNGDLGHAVLWYERAQVLIPNDPDLTFNLNYAHSLLKDENEEISSPIFQVVFFWKDMLQTTTLQWVVLILNLLFWLCLGVYRYFRMGGLFHVCLGVLILLIFALATTGWRMYEERYSPNAVILEPAVSVRSGYASESTELFVLHAGTKVTVEKQTKGFIKIRFSKDKIGWIPDQVAGVI